MPKPTKKSPQGRDSQASTSKVVGSNKKATFDFFIEDTIETGIMLLGPEVKSLRDGKANLRDGYAKIVKEELFLYNVHISPYTFTTNSPPDPLRVRKLLLHKREIKKLIGKVKEKGVALIPLKIYFKANGKAKLALGLARGKKLYDKRDAIKGRENDREMNRLNKGNRY
ncbi:MAG: SsrA-binding protein SmpB [Desulfobulbaceae bacterium]|nr:SsrA-binding protein SmpB [Desulfobulbaceae bacterium]